MEGEFDDSFIPSSSISAAIVVSRKANLLLSNDRTSTSNNSAVVQICVVVRIPKKRSPADVLLSEEDNDLVRAYTIQCFVFIDDSRRLVHLDSLLTRFANNLSRVVISSTENAEVSCAFLL